MQFRFGAILAAFALFSGITTISARAQAPAGYETIYDAPTKVNLAGRPVMAGIAFHADMAAAERGDLRLILTTDVTKFVEETERDLENWIAARRQDCGERWSSGKPFIGFPDNAIRFALYLELEYWTCGWNGKGEPARIATEAGGIDVTLIPSVVDGKLQASLGDFAIDERSGVSKYLPLEFVVRRVLEQELVKLNKNPKFYRAPKPLIDEGFRYESIAAEEHANGRVVITAIYHADGDTNTLDRIVEKLHSDGISQ